MTDFTGTAGADTADASTGALTGFSGGTVANLTDDQGDFFKGLAGNDFILAGPGNDRLRGGLGSDDLRGGAGNDTVDYLDNFGPVFINLYIGQGFGNAAEGDTYDSIESATGTIYADWLLGTAGANVLDGSQGDDFLIGYFGADTLIGGAGFDIAVYEDGAGSVFINMLEGRGYNNSAEGDILNGIEGIIGTSNADVIIGNSTTYTSGSRNYIDAGAGDDVVVRGTGRVDTLIGGSGEDTLSLELSGGFVELNSGGMSGFENVRGSVFRDTIVGDDGNNVIWGREGDDVLTGGGGVDTFVFDTPLRPSDVDNLTDFSEFDQIYLDRSIFTALPSGELAAEAFTNGAAVSDAEDRVIYNQATGALFYDSDGTGPAAAQLFAVLQGSPQISHTEFYVIG